MSDKVYILLESYINNSDYHDYYNDRFIGVFSTEESAITAARKKAISELGYALDSLTDDCGCYEDFYYYFGDYDEWRDENGSYIINFSKYERENFAIGSYKYEISSICINSESESYEPKVNIDIQPSYESIKAAEAAFKNVSRWYYNDHVAPLDIDKVEEDFSEEFIREQNNLSNGKEV